MAVTVARLQAILSSDTSDFDRGMDRSEKRSKVFGGPVKAATALSGAEAGTGFVRDKHRRHGRPRDAQPAGGGTEPAG